jgi:hypothetical protein
MFGILQVKGGCGGFQNLFPIFVGVFQLHQYNLVYPRFRQLGLRRRVPAVSMATPIEHTVEKGEKRSFSALFEHIQFCERSMKRSALKYPWQLGFLADQDQSTFPKGPLGMAPVLPAAVSSSDVAEAVHEELASAFDDHCRRLYCKLPQVEWDVHLDSQRSAALAKWHKIVLADPMSFDVCRMHFQSLKTGLQGGKLQDDLRNVFSSKSTSTLHGRAGPMMRFLHFCADKQVKAFPITEEVVYAFMQHVEQSAAPTFLRSFLSSLGFALHVVGLIGAKRVLDSRRIKGLADKCYLQKKKTRSRLPLTVEELTTLEEIVLGQRGRGLPDRHAAGCFLFMVYARTRFSDMLNVGRLEFEAGDDETRYIEAQVARSKTSFSVDRKVRLLPMTAAMHGVTTESWGKAWKTVLEKTGIAVTHGKPLLPGRTPDGWHTLPLTAEAATSWLRSMLQSGDHFQEDRIKSVGTHSCKSTILSWMAKWGSSPDLRRLMGYHVADKMSTMLIYGKDNTSAGLREIDVILEAIRQGEFLPDAKRSEMFPHAEDAAKLLEGQDQSGFEGYCSGSSSEDSADEDQPDHLAHEKAENAVLGKWDAGVDVSKLPDQAVYFRHPLSRTIHVQEDESGIRFTCGRDISKSYISLESRPQSLLPICKQCFARFRKAHV